MIPKPFSLGTVLSFRKRQENIAQEKFIQAKIAVKIATQELEIAKHDLNTLIKTLEEKQNKGILAMELARFEERIHYDRIQLQFLKNSLDDRQKTAQRRRKTLLEKAKDYKVLNTLKEQQNSAWKNYLEKKEAAMLDEIAILRHNRKIN